MNRYKTTFKTEQDYKDFLDIHSEKLETLEVSKIEFEDWSIEVLVTNPN